MEVLLGDVVIWVKWRQGLGDHEGIQEGGKYWVCRGRIVPDAFRISEMELNCPLSGVTLGN